MDAVRTAPGHPSGLIHTVARWDRHGVVRLPLSSGGSSRSPQDGESVTVGATIETMKWRRHHRLISGTGQRLAPSPVQQGEGGDLLLVLF